VPSDGQQSGGDLSKDGISCLSIFWTFFRIGLLTLGGGLAMATVMRHELVIKRRWVKDDDFVSEFSTATVVPGAIAVNIAYLQGRRLRSRRGSLVAVCGTVLPSFCTILAVVIALRPYFEQPRVAAFLKGCAVAVAGQLAFTAYLFGKKLLRNWRSIVVCALGLGVVAFAGVHPIWAIVTASLASYALFSIK